MRGVKKGGADKQARNGTHRPASDFESNSSPIRFRKGAGPISDQIDSCSRPSLTKSSTKEQSNERTNERTNASRRIGRQASQDFTYISVQSTYCDTARRRTKAVLGSRKRRAGGPGCHSRSMCSFFSEPPCAGCWASCAVRRAPPLIDLCLSPVYFWSLSLSL